MQFTATVPRGAQAQLAANTVAGAQCQLMVYFPQATYSASATADGMGNVSWTWTVLASTAPGTYPVVVGASSGGLTGSQVVYLTVQ